MGISIHPQERWNTQALESVPSSEPSTTELVLGLNAEPVAPPRTEPEPLPKIKEAAATFLITAERLYDAVNRRALRHPQVATRIFVRVP